ncbi:MAG: sugar ABC transporter permease, partial [bacterium]
QFINFLIEMLNGFINIIFAVIGLVSAFITGITGAMPPLIGNCINLFVFLIAISILVRCLLAFYVTLEKRSTALPIRVFVLLGVLLFLGVFKFTFPTEFAAEFKPFWLIGGNTMWAIIIPTIWRYWPFSMLMILAGLQGIPEELYEASDIDGASPWKKFWMITWPLLKPVWSVLILFGMIYNVYSFNIVYMMFGFGAGFPGTWGDLMMTNIFRNSFQLWNFGAGAAISVILMILMIIAVNIWFRNYQKAEEIQ